jgi:predicted transcriptional regulator
MTSPTSVFVASGLTQGEIAKLTRVRRGLTQWQVAQLAQIAPWAVCAYERGTRYVPPAWVRRIRYVLDLEEWA